MHTIDELKEKQSLPLDVKISLTIARVRAWVNEYGSDGVYISFSGGKDSTVLMDIIRNKMGYTDIPAVFVDVPTQYPELKSFAKTWDDVEILSPKISFMQVCEKYGFPLISKEVSECVYGARSYVKKLKQIEEERTQETKIPNSRCYADIVGVPRRGSDKNNPDFENIKKGILPNSIIAESIKQSEDAYDAPERFQNLMGYRRSNGDLHGKNFKYGELSYCLMLEGKYPHTQNGQPTDEMSRRYNKSKYKFFLDAPFEISNRCCSAMKKDPLRRYTKETGRLPITAQMAEESALRREQWLHNGCNGFHMKKPISNPMSFWTEQDILKYIKENNLQICSVYGEVVEDYEAEGIMDGQITFDDFREQQIFKTTGCKRTGCMLCGFGCHTKGDNRFLLLKETHPKMYNLLDIVKNNGVTFREAIEWTNEHGGLDIKL